MNIYEVSLAKIRQTWKIYNILNTSRRPDILYGHYQRKQRTLASHFTYIFKTSH